MSSAIVTIVLANRHDERPEALGRLFASVGCTEICWVRKTGTGVECVQWNASSAQWNTPPSNRMAATVVLVHSSDWAFWSNNRHSMPSGGKVFTFDATGTPTEKDGTHPLFRATRHPNFELVQNDARQICAYSTDKTGTITLPLCCQRGTKQTPDNLAALSILCQGYQLAQMDASLSKAAHVAQSSWWREPFGDAVKAALMRALAKECGTSVGIPPGIQILAGWMFGDPAELNLDEAVAKVLVELRPLLERP